MKKTTIAILIEIAMLLLASGCVQQPAPEEKIRIGVLGSLTGSYAPYGQAGIRAIEIAVEEINLQGGIGGKIIELVVEDTKNDAKTAASAAQKLIEVDGAKAILSDSSTMTLTIAPIANQNKIPVMGYISTSPAVSLAGNFVFRTSPSNIEGMKQLANFALEKFNYAKIGAISELIDYPQGTRQVFVEEFEGLSGEIVADEKFDSGATDLKTQLLKIKGANPDAVLVLAQSPGTAALVLKQIKELGISQQILGNEVITSAETTSLAGEAAEGAISAEPDFDQSSEIAAKLIEKYKAKGYPDPPQWIYVATAYDAMQIIAEAINKVGTDGEKIKDYLYTIKDRQGATGKLSFDENGDPKINYSIKTIKNGKLEKYERG